MTVVWVAVALIVVLGGAAAVLTGRGEPLAEADRDRPDVLVPRDRPLRGADLREIRFSTALRGYRADEVDALLDRLAGELDDSTATREGRVERSFPVTPDETRD